MIWQVLGPIYIWPICGNDMGRLGDHMEFIWGQIFANFKLWKVWEEKLMLPIVWESYGDRIPTEIPYQ